MRILMALVLVTAWAGLAGANPKQSTAALVAKGKTSYATNCAACHGELGDGNGAAGAMLNPKPRDLRTTDAKQYKNGSSPEQLYKSITEGLPGTTMVGFSFLSEEDRWAIVHYIRADFQGAGKATAKKK
jgi:mono/diheme cytochrome c family protein